MKWNCLVCPKLKIQNSLLVFPVSSTGYPAPRAGGRAYVRLRVVNLVPNFVPNLIPKSKNTGQGSGQGSRQSFLCRTSLYLRVSGALRRRSGLCETPGLIATKNTKIHKKGGQYILQKAAKNAKNYIIAHKLLALFAIFCSKCVSVRGVRFLAPGAELV